MLHRRQVLALIRQDACAPHNEYEKFLMQPASPMAPFNFSWSVHRSKNHHWTPGLLILTLFFVTHSALLVQSIMRD
eukprot:1626623-Amphidinium_carterae.1